MEPPEPSLTHRDFCSHERPAADRRLTTRRTILLLGDQSRKQAHQRGDSVGDNGEVRWVGWGKSLRSFQCDVLGAYESAVSSCFDAEPQQVLGLRR